MVSSVLRLDYVSCALTVLSTVLVGRKLWQGWVVAGVNSVIICVIGMKTSQFGFIPANLFCIALYSYNIWIWRVRKKDDRSKDAIVQPPNIRETVQEQML